MGKIVYALGGIKRGGWPINYSEIESVEKIEIVQVNPAYLSGWDKFANDNAMDEEYDFSKVVIDRTNDKITVRCPLESNMVSKTIQYTFKVNVPLLKRRYIVDDNLIIPKHKELDYQVYDARDIAVWTYNEKFKKC